MKSRTRNDCQCLLWTSTHISHEAVDCMGIRALWYGQKCPWFLRHILEFGVQFFAVVNGLVCVWIRSHEESAHTVLNYFTKATGIPILLAATLSSNPHLRSKQNRRLDRPTVLLERNATFITFLAVVKCFPRTAFDTHVGSSIASPKYQGCIKTTTSDPF